MLDPRGDRPPASSSVRRNHGFPGSWCCSFTAASQSPDCRPSSCNSYKQPQAMAISQVPSAGNSVHSSPSSSSKLALGIIDPRRILSPGRVSPIDSDVLFMLPEKACSVVAIDEQEISDPSLLGDDKSNFPAEVASEGFSPEKGLDLKLKVTDSDGGCLVMRMNSEVLCSNSSYFAGMILRSRRKVSDAFTNFWEVEVEGVDDLNAFKETIELIYCNNPINWLMNAGVSRSIYVLEVSAAVMFYKGTISCLKYLESVPWTEHEEEKLKSLFSRCSFDESVSEQVLARLHPQSCRGSEEVAMQLIRSVVNGTNGNARKKMQDLVNGLLSKSSVYFKEPIGLNKDSMYSTCSTCLNSLVELFKEASTSLSVDLGITMAKEQSPLLERVSKQVENLNWLLDILTDKQMAVDFVQLWGVQDELIWLHERTSAMIRYEVSRISAGVFLAIGRGKVQCPRDLRHAVLCRWFRPFLLDFGWIQRHPKGLDMRKLEEGLGQAILTLSLTQQQVLFVEWFHFFGAGGRECPNLSKAFKIWWRRSFVRGVESHASS